MKLFTKQINDNLFKQFPKGSQLSSQVVVAKIFNPYGKGRWFLINSDPQDPNYLWAIVEMGGIIEVGSVSRKELESIRVTAWRFPLERDLSFRPQNALEIYNGLNQGKFYKRGGKTDDCGCNTMANGGEISDENKEMLENQSVEIMHHAKELGDVVKKTNVVEPWVIGKVERSATDLSDVTHYLDGESKKMAKGGKLDVAKIKEEYEINEDNNAHSENVVLLAKYFGSDSDLRDAKTILAKHEAIGNLPSYLRDERDVLSRKLYKKMVLAQDKMAQGGVLYVDLFEEREKMPNDVEEILERYEDEYGEDITYEALLQMQEDMENVGYTFDYGLDSIPYGLRPMGVDIKQLRGYDDDEYANGGVIKWQDVNKGDSALVISENKLGLVIKTYGRKFHLRFADGTEKTYDASELKFIKDDDEYAKGGGIAFIPMDLEDKLMITAKWGGTDIKGVIGILNAMIDSGMTDGDLKTKPTKSGSAYQNQIEKKTKEIWAKIKPKYKGEFEGNQYYSTISRLVSRAETNDEILKRYKPFKKYEKKLFYDGGMMAKGGLIATSPSLEGIKKIIGNYYYSPNILLKQIEGSNEYEVHNAKGKISSVKVVEKKGRFQFLERDKFLNGGQLDVGRYYKTKGGKQFRYLGKTQDPQVGTFTNKTDGVSKIRYDEIEGQDSLFANGGIVAYANDDYENKISSFSSMESAKKFAKANKWKYESITFEDENGDNIVVSKEDSFKDVDWLFSDKMADGGIVAYANDDYENKISSFSSMESAKKFAKANKWKYESITFEDENGDNIVVSKEDSFKDVDWLFSDKMADGGMMGKGGEIKPEKPIEKMTKLELMRFVGKLNPTKHFYPKTTKAGRVQAKNIYNEYLSRKKMAKGGKTESEDVGNNYHHLYILTARERMKSKMKK